jgi:SSS family solute:Na+ symporter
MNYLTLLVLAYLAALLWFGIRGGTRERELNAFLTAGGSAGKRGNPGPPCGRCR